MIINNLDRQASHFDVVVQWVFDEWSPISPFETLASTRTALLQRAGEQRVPIAYVAQSPTGRPLGIVSLVECDYAPRNDLMPWVADMYVSPDNRNRGIGSGLVVYIETRANEAGFTNLFLITRHQRRFYERLGWTVLDQLHYQGESAVLMQRDLPTGPTRLIESTA